MMSSLVSSLIPRDIYGMMEQLDFIFVMQAWNWITWPIPFKYSLGRKSVARNAMIILMTAGLKNNTTSKRHTPTG